MNATPPGVTAYPLHWPTSRPRTRNRERPKFTVSSFTAARDGLFNQVRLLRATNVVLSTNIELRRDGLPYANRTQPDDPGVAVYFVRKGKQVCFACDRWQKVEHNMRAIADAIECIRTIERRGTGDMADAAFTGFAALPPASSPTGQTPQPWWAGKPWWEVLKGQAHHSTEAIIDLYRQRARECHPDRGGDTAEMAAVNAAYEQFKRERGIT